MVAQCTTPAATMHHFIGDDAPSSAVKLHFLSGVCTLSEWVAAVNSLGEYGEWCNDVSYNIADVEGIIAKYI